MKISKIKFLLKLLLLMLVIFGCKSPIKRTWIPEILSEQVQKDHYLPDFSYAGYHWGEEPLPNVNAKLNVSAYGAIPNDGKDDTAALLKAFAAANGIDGPVTIKFSKGKFILKDILYINRSNIVLQGEGSGPDGTIIYMPQPLNKLKIQNDLKELQEYLVVNNKRQREPERGIDEIFSLYAWSGGYIWTRCPGERPKVYMSKYNKKETELAIVKSGKRGGHTVEVENASSLKAGMIVRINWYNHDGKNSSLIKHLYDDQSVEVGRRHWESADIPIIKQEVTIEKIEGNLVTIKEPLLHDLRPEWFPRMSEWKHISEVGIEHIQFEFAFEEYYAHHLESGYNAIYMTNTTHSWVRDVAIKNGDSGFISDNCSNVTVKDVTVSGRKYHYAVQFGDCYNMLAQNVRVLANVIHSLSFNTGARSCVFTNSFVATAPSLDQHSGANHQNLFDNIKIIEDEPDRSFFYMGGAGYWAPTHGAFSTFWNIQVQFDYDDPGDQPIKIAGVTDGPSARLVGLTANYPMEITYGPNAYMEGVNKPGIAFPSLYEYQLQKRTNNSKNHGENEE
jgi:hypothetical protein